MKKYLTCAPVCFFILLASGCASTAISFDYDVNLNTRSELNSTTCVAEVKITNNGRKSLYIGGYTVFAKDDEGNILGRVYDLAQIYVKPGTFVLLESSNFRASEKRAERVCQAPVTEVYLGFVK